MKDPSILPGLLKAMDDYAQLEHDHQITLVRHFDRDSMLVKVTNLSQHIEEENASFEVPISYEGKFKGHRMVAIGNGIFIVAIAQYVVAAILEM